MPEPPRGGGGALSGTTFGLVAWSRVWPANVFRAHSWSARSGSMVPSGFGVIRLVAIAFRTAPSVHPRPRAYARIETPIRLPSQVRTTLCLDSFGYRGAYLPCVPEYVAVTSHFVGPGHPRKKVARQEPKSRGHPTLGRRSRRGAPGCVALDGVAVAIHVK